MKPNELIVGGYYVRKEKHILHFYSASADGESKFHAYNLSDGRYSYTSSCAFGTMMIWAERKATAEEISKLQPKESYGEGFERRSSALRQAIRSSGHSDLDYGYQTGGLRKRRGR